MAAAASLLLGYVSLQALVAAGVSMDSFDSAVADGSALRKLDTAQQLRLYALYKRAVAGECAGKKPALWDVRGRAKWEAWSAAGALTEEVARAEYCALVALLKVPPPAEPEPEPACNIWEWARDGDAAAVRAALDAGAAAGGGDEGGMTPLMWASDGGCEEVVALLLVRGADPNAAAQDGQTALHFCAVCDRPACASLLLAGGADRGIADGDGMTAAQEAALSHSEAVAKLLGSVDPGSSRRDDFLRE